MAEDLVRRVAEVIEAVGDRVRRGAQGRVGQEVVLRGVLARLGHAVPVGAAVVVAGFVGDDVGHADRPALQRGARARELGPGEALERLHPEPGVILSVGIPGVHVLRQPDEPVAARIRADAHDLPAVLRGRGRIGGGRAHLHVELAVARLHQLLHAAAKLRLRADGRIELGEVEIGERRGVVGGAREISELGEGRDVAAGIHEIQGAALRLREGARGTLLGG